MNITNELLSAYLDNALSPRDRAEVDRALASSPDLQKELARLRRLGNLLREIPAAEPSETFYQSILEKTKPRPRAWLPWTVPLVGAATMAVVMVYLGEQHKTLPEVIQFQGDAPLNVKTMSVPQNPETTSDDPASPSTKGLVGGSLPTWDGAEKGAGMVEDRGRESPAREIETFSRRASAPSAIGLEGNAATAGRSKTKDLQQQTPPPAKSESTLDSQRRAPEPKKSISKGLLEPRADKIAANETGEPMTEWKGDHSGITDYEEVVVKDAASWTALWARHESDKTSPAPAVNFNTHMVVGLFLGNRGSSGHDVLLTEIKYSPNTIIVSYKEILPAPGMAQLTVLTQPFHLKVVPRSETPVRFKKR